MEHPADHHHLARAAYRALMVAVPDVKRIETAARIRSKLVGLADLDAEALDELDAPF